MAPRRRKTVITNKSSNKMLQKFYNYLDSLYLDVKKPASFTSAEKLMKEVERRGYYSIDDMSIIYDYLDGVHVMDFISKGRQGFHPLPHPPCCCFRTEYSVFSRFDDS